MVWQWTKLQVKGYLNKSVLSRQEGGNDKRDDEHLGNTFGLVDLVQLEHDLIHKGNAEENGEITQLHQVEGKLVMLTITDNNRTSVPDKEGYE